MGSLEADVLRYLWNAAEPATPGQVNEALGGEVANTTVMTVLTRLWRKGLVDRERNGRAFAYRPLVSEADYAGQRMGDALGRAQDREAVLSRFVDTLSARDAKALRRDLVEDKARTRQVATDIATAVGDGRNVLVLTQWTEHLDALTADLTARGLEPLVLKGGLGKKPEQL